MRLGYLSLSIVFLVSWGCCRKFLPPSTIDKTDSIRVEYRETVRLDTVLVDVPRERVEVQVPVDTTSTISTSLAISYAGLSGGLLWHRLENRQDADRLNVPVTAIDTHRDSVRTERVVIREPYPVSTPFTWWQRFRMNFGGWALIASTLTSGWWIIKKLI